MMKNKFSALTFAAFLIAAALLSAYSQQPASNQEKIAALQDMLNSGLLTQQEYDAKVRALSAPAEESYSGGPVPTKTAGVFDPTLGGILFKSYVIPADWMFQGAMTQGTGCNVAAYPFFRASSPDGLTGVKIFPPTEYAWNDNPRGMANSPPGCIPREGEIEAADYMNYVIKQLNAEFVKDTTDPETVAEIRKNVTPLDPYHPAKWRMSYRDFASSQVIFNINSLKEEEEIVVNVYCDDQSDMTRIHRYSCAVIVGTTWAPAGRLASTLEMLHSIAKVNEGPAWRQAWAQRNNAQWAAIRANNAAATTAFYSNLNQQIISSGENFRAQQNARFATHEAQIGAMQQNGANNLALQQQRWSAQQAHTDDVVDSILNQQKRYDPTTGQIYKSDSAYAYNWVSSDGRTYYPTNDINDNPNGRGNGTWTLAPNVNAGSYAH
jgi:hypothetical protein